MSTGDGVRHIRWFLFSGGIATLVLAAATVSAWAQFRGFGGMGPPPANGIFGWLLGQQAFFYQALAGMLRAAKTNGSAYWGLMGISLVYGVFHAAGPGHGKAVISSYLLANEETWRRGITLSFASAVLQSITAIAIVAIAALLINATAQMMGDTVRIIETVSYGLIIVIGARLAWVKGKSFHAALRKMHAGTEAANGDPPVSIANHPAARGVTGNLAEAHSCVTHGQDGHMHGEHAHADHAHAGCTHHAHQHDDDEEENVLPWGHAHGPEPEELAGPGGWRRGLSAIVAVGLRPCSGAIIILVFALSQGLFWAGVASTFVMGLGTAITVSTIASLAVGAKSFAKRISRRPTGYGVLVLRGFEVCAACLVMLVGVALLSGYMASEQMGFF